MSLEPSAQRIYLDNAATSWPKPEAVYAAVDDYQRRLGASAGRSGYAEAVEVAQRIAAARRDIARFLGLKDADHLVFTQSGTDSLNLVLHGFLKPGDHVVTTVAEHNSVLRPLWHRQQCGIETTTIGCSAEGIVDPAAIRQAIRPQTRLVVVTHASNVTGAIQPVKEIASIARDAEVAVLCDAAQTAGHEPLCMETLGVDFLALPGHKGLLGPLGTGLVAIRPGMAAQLSSWRQGGTGTHSEQFDQPNELPAKFEAGNLNVPGILGLAAGVQYLQTQGIEQIAKQGRDLCQRLCDGLRGVPGVRVWGPGDREQRVPVVSITVENFDPQEVALGLDAVYQVQVRSGLHCAPRMHAALGTQAEGGTVRFSLGPFTTQDDVDKALRAVAEFCSLSM